MRHGVSALNCQCVIHVGLHVQTVRHETSQVHHSGALTTVCTMQSAVPTQNSVISLMLRTTNRKTGTGLTDMQVVAQSNVFIVAGVLQKVLLCYVIWPQLSRLRRRSFVCMSSSTQMLM